MWGRSFYWLDILLDGLDLTVFEVKDALVAAAAEFEREVALLHDEWAVNERVEFANKIPDRAFVWKLFEDETSEGPNIPAEFFFAEFSDFEASFSLEKRFAAAESDAALPFELTEFFFDLFDWNESATIVVLSPSFRVLAARAMLAATLRPENGAEAWAINDRIVLEVAREADIAIRNGALRITKFVRIRSSHILILDEKAAGCESCGFFGLKFTLCRARP